MTLNCNCHESGGALSQTVSAVLERPRYSPGLILRDSDLTAAVEYTRDLNRLLFRNLFGCGVVCGLIVNVDEHCGLRVTVGAGLALDGCGDPIQVAKPVVITVDDRKVEEWKSRWKTEAKDQDKKDDAYKFWIVLCGKEKFCEPRELVCDSDEFDGSSQHTRIRSQAEVTIALTRPVCVCRCAKPRQASNGGANPATQPAVDGQTPSGNDDGCQAEHNERDECVEDCGCGSACACGCCVLLAEVEYSGDGWQPDHGVRRLVRPMMVPDHKPVEKKDANEPQTTVAASAAPAIAGSAGGDTIVASMNGQPLTRRQFGDLLVEHFMKDTKPRSVKLENLKVILESANPASPAVNTASNLGGGI